MAKVLHVSMSSRSSNVHEPQHRLPTNNAAVFTRPSTPACPLSSQPTLRRGESSVLRVSANLRFLFLLSKFVELRRKAANGPTGQDM